MKALAPARTADPAERLLSLADAKIHLRVDGTDEDALIASLILAAEQHIDGYSGVLGKALVNQTWRQSFDAFPDGRLLRLPLGPLQGTPTIAYYDAAGVSQSFTSFVAVSDTIGPLLVLNYDASWPTTATRPDAVTVTWTAGHGAAVTAVPAPIVHAARLLVGHWYAHREGVNVGNIVSELPLAVDALLSPFRAVGI